MGMRSEFDIEAAAGTAAGRVVDTAVGRAADKAAGLAGAAAEAAVLPVSLVPALALLEAHGLEVLVMAWVVLQPGLVLGLVEEQVMVLVVLQLERVMLQGFVDKELKEMVPVLHILSAAMFLGCFSRPFQS
jgi:hypothetical protein